MIQTMKSKDTSISSCRTLQDGKLQEFAPLNVGWAKGMIQYGTGLMIQTLDVKKPTEPVIILATLHRYILNSLQHTTAS